MVDSLKVQFIKWIVNLPDLNVVLQKMLEMKKYILDQQDMRSGCST